MHASMNSFGTSALSCAADVTMTCKQVSISQEKQQEYSTQPGAAGGPEEDEERRFIQEHDAGGGRRVVIDRSVTTLTVNMDRTTSQGVSSSLSPARIVGQPGGLALISQNLWQPP